MSERVDPAIVYYVSYAITMIAVGLAIAGMVLLFESGYDNLADEDDVTTAIDAAADTYNSSYYKSGPFEGSLGIDELNVRGLASQTEVGITRDDDDEENDFAMLPDGVRAYDASMVNVDGALEIRYGDRALMTFSSDRVESHVEVIKDIGIVTASFVNAAVSATGKVTFSNTNTVGTQLTLATDTVTLNPQFATFVVVATCTLSYVSGDDLATAGLQIYVNGGPVSIASRSFTLSTTPYPQECTVVYSDTLSQASTIELYYVNTPFTGGNSTDVAFDGKFVMYTVS